MRFQSMHRKPSRKGVWRPRELDGGTVKAVLAGTLYISRLGELPEEGHAYGRGVIVIFDTRLAGYPTLFPAGLLGHVLNHVSPEWSRVKTDRSETLVDFGGSRGVHAFKKSHLRLSD